MRCTKAIIPVAGYGTRRLPITKTIEKCMLPMLNRPIIDYVVEDCVKAGITDIYIVVSPGSTQIQEYYRTNVGLERYLQANNKAHHVPLITPPPVRFHFVEQDTQAGAKYGTSVPVWLCREFIEPDEHVLVLMGDDFFYNTDGSSEAARLITAAKKGASGSAILGVEVPKERVSNYGVIAANRAHDRLLYEAIQEQPSVEEARSNLINVSKYIFDAAFFDYLEQNVATKQTGEYRITDAMNDYVAGGHFIEVLAAKGTYLDGGTVESWLAANNYLASVA